MSQADQNKDIPELLLADGHVNYMMILLCSTDTPRNSKHWKQYCPSSRHCICICAHSNQLFICFISVYNQPWSSSATKATLIVWQSFLAAVCFVFISSTQFTLITYKVFEKRKLMDDDKKEIKIWNLQWFRALLHTIGSRCMDRKPELENKPKCNVL